MASRYQPGLRVSEYVLDACVGTGSFAEVWRAVHHIWKDERVAVKLPIEPDYVRFLQREGVVVHGVRHPNLIRVLGLDPYADTPYLVMEYVDGPSLKQVIGEHPRGLPVKTAVTVLHGVLQGVGAAHEAGVLHRDLKPGNVLLNLAGRPLEQLEPAAVKVSDFGFGMHSGDAVRTIANSASLARDEQLVGTLAYMAPELRDKGGQPDARSDLYSLGVMLFEMLTGERPAGAELPSTLRSDTPVLLDQVYQKLYARHDRRYAGAAAVLADLLKLETAPTRSVPAPGAVRPPPLPPHVRPGETLPPRKWVTGPPLPPPPLPADVARAQGVCAQCRRAVAREDQFCTGCGAQLVQNVRRCRECGGYPGPRDRYCIFCGATLAAAEA